MPGPLHGFGRSTFVDAVGKHWTYYSIGEGPPVMVLHEVYGLSPSDLSFCRRLSNAGFKVYAPLLFGTPGKKVNFWEAFAYLGRVCVSGEFAAFAHNRSSPIAQVLRALGREMIIGQQRPRFGVVGLCLTGNFALAMMADKNLLAPVVSEPALPAALCKSARQAIGLSSSEIATVNRRISEGIKILGFRFKSDIKSPKERFETMRRVFGEGFEGHCIDRSPNFGNHSVFTQDYDPNWTPTLEAFERLVGFLTARLS